MSRRLTRILLLLLLLIAGQAMALGLGDIRLQSALNQPLRVEIDLLAAAPEELTNLTIQLASEATFKRYGLDRPFFLADMTFTLVKSGTTSGNTIHVTTTKPVTEPFVTFLVEAIWSRGRLLREYTILLDPPTFAPPPVTKTTQAVTAPSRSTQTDAGRIERPATTTPRQDTPPPATRPPPRVQAPVQSAPADPAPQTQSQPEYTASDDVDDTRDYSPPDYSASEPPRETYVTLPSGELLIQTGDTLWSIARQYRPDSSVSMDQMMIALFEANPDAFINNINVLTAGSRLRIPMADDIYSINRGDAQTDVARQHAEWRGEAVPAMPEPSTEPSLTLVPPDDDQTGYEDDPSSAGDSFSREYEIEDRIIELEANVPDQPALLEIHNNELAQLRAELARLRGEEPPVELPVEDEPLLDDGAAIDDPIIGDEVVDDDEIFMDDEAADDAAADAADDEIAAPVVTRPAAKPSLVDTVLGYVFSVWGAIAGAVLLVIVILIWFARRAGRDDDEDPTGLWETLDTGDVDSESLASTERLRAMARNDDSSIVVVEQESKAAMAAEMAGDKPADDAPAAPVAAADPSDDTATNDSLEDTFSSETAINLDQSDPIAEADFHMAYGLHDQAADLITGALEAEPQRQDLLAKLCEVYFVWGNRDGFIDAAKGMKNVVGDTSSAEWDKIIIMGQQIAEDHELFSGKTAGEATKAVDLSFDDGSDKTGALDMDLAGGTEGAVSDVIDLGAESGESEALGDASSIDFAFEEEVDTAASETRDMATDAEEEGLDDVFGEAAVDLSADEETADKPAALEEPAEVEESSGTQSIEKQFETFDPTSEVKAMEEIADDDLTEFANLDDELSTTDATAEINLDDLGLDLDSLGEASLAADLESNAATLESDLENTSSVEALSMDDLEATGENVEVDLGDALAVTGQNIVLDMDDQTDATGLQQALGDSDATGLQQVLAETDASDMTSKNPVLPDFDDLSIPGDDPESETSLLDATGQTQVLPDDFAVDTTGNANDLIADDDKTMMASLDSEEPPLALPEDAETLLAPLDDDDDLEFTKTEALSDDETSDFDFAKTEALPKDVFIGEPTTDETGELPALTGSTDMDLDLDDLTAALKVSEVGDTINQARDDATVQQPRLRPEPDTNLGVTLDDDEDDEPTQALSPDQVSDDLHDARTMTEVGTKLDLARAYVDMGDPAGARSILEEVLNEGDEGQKQQAQQLLDSLPS
jgi:pilus assembly protein FimV